MPARRPIGVALALALVVPVLAAALVAALVVGSGGEEGDRAGWTRVLDEDFGGSTLDATTWHTCFWWAQGDGCTIASNDEEQWYQPHRVTVSDGILRLHAAVEAARTDDGEVLPFTSGMVSTGRTGDEPEDGPGFAFTYGLVRVRFRAPAGAGLWPAVWLLPTTNESKPEVDLLELYGQEPTRPAMTLHASGTDVVRAYADTADLSVGWHTVELDWGAGRLEWRIDGRVVHAVAGDRVPSEPMYIVMDLALGGPAGAVDREALPAAFEVDSVEVWQP